MAWNILYSQHSTDCMSMNETDKEIAQIITHFWRAFRDINLTNWSRCVDYFNIFDFYSSIDCSFWQLIMLIFDKTGEIAIERNHKPSPTHVTYYAAISNLYSYTLYFQL